MLAESRDAAQSATGPARRPLSFASGRATLLVAIATLLVGTTLADIYPLSGARFIGHADEAHLAMLARNIAEGRGAVSDVVWLLTDGGMPGNSVTHPEDYWSIYAAAIIAVLFKVFGATYPVVLLGASLFKSATALLCGYWVSVLTGRNRAAIFAAVAAVSLWPTMLRVVQGLSDVYLTFFVLLFVTFLALAVSRKRPALFWTAGMALGVAIGIKPSGALLLGLVAAFAVLARRVVLKPRNAALLFAGGVIALVPLASHNLSAFGELAIVRPPAFALVEKAAAIREATGNHDLGFYDPGPAPVDRTSTLGKAQAALHRVAVWMRDGAFGSGLIPSFMLFFVPCFYVRRCWTTLLRAREVRSAGDVFAVSTLLLVVGALALASAVHYEERYWNFLFPLLTVTTIAAMAALWRGFLVLFIAGAMIGGAYFYYARKVDWVPQAYAELARIVPTDAIIMTPNPWETAFHTRMRSVATPYTDDEKAVRNVAARYGAQYLVLIDRDARHRFYRPMQESGEVPPFLERIYFSPELLVAKFKP